MLWHPKDFQSTRCDSPGSLGTESPQDVSRSSNTDVSILPSKVGVSQPANKPDDRGCTNYPKWSLEEATPTPERQCHQARQTKMNYGVVVPTPKLHSTLNQLLKSWRGSGGSKVDSHGDQHPPSDNDKPDDSGYLSPTDSESDDLTLSHKKICTRVKALTANDQSSAVQLNPDAHEFKPQDCQHSTQDPTSAARPKERPDFPRDKRSASIDSKAPQENSGLLVKTPKNEVSNKEDEDLVLKSFFALHK